VSVFQSPCGTRPISRLPRRQRPRVRTILVLVAVSSMNTSRPGSSVLCFRIQCRRARATSGRSCSAACRVFFNADIMALEETMHRATATRNPRFAHRSNHFVQCQIRLLVNQGQQPLRVLLQWRDAPSNRLRRRAPRRLPPLHPLDRRTWTQIEPFGSLPTRRTSFDRPNHPLAQVPGIRLRHCSVPQKAKPMPPDSLIRPLLGIPRMIRPIQNRRDML
jgi:hypothetical protein